MSSSVSLTLDLLRPMTDEELAAISARNPGYHFERTARGELIVSPTGAEGGRRNAAVLAQLHNWNQRGGLGVVFDSSTGFKLADGSCRAPDASWVRRDRWRSLSPAQRQGFPPICPDAVFEVRSASDSLTELQAKLRLYLDSGALLGLLVDPDDHAVEVYRPGHQPRRRQGERTIDLGPELAGFTLDLGPLFDD